MYYFHIIVFIISVIYIYHRFILSQREKASYQMYKLRDDFVYLVASERLTETDPVFSYYYKRINLVLAMAPNVGLDDLLAALFHNTKNIDKSLEKAKEKVDKILQSESAKDEEVKALMEEYYRNIKYMMLSHSSILRIIFILTKKLNPLARAIEKIIPKNNVICGAYKVTQYADEELRDLLRA